MNNIKRLIILLSLITSMSIGQSNIPPPVIVTPPIPIVTVTTQVVSTTTMVTNATLIQFIIYIDKNQNPTRFISIFSDKSIIITDAKKVGSLANRDELNIFNGLLQDVVANGVRMTNTVNKVSQKQKH
jgi:hypothetical protein